MVHARVLLVDDEEDMLAGLQRTLERNITGLEVVTATRPSQALRLMTEQSFDLALLDVMMPEMNGIALLEKLRQKDPELSVVMMTAFASIDLAVEAIHKGAYDFITKPFEKETILRVINKGLERNRLLRENITLKKQVCQKEAFGSFVGQSPVMEKFYERLKIVAMSDYTVLVRGESGTGKELTARAIHHLSKRRNRPLVMVNCPAIPNICWKANSSAISVGPSPELIVIIPVFLWRRMAAASVWTRSRISRCRCRPNCCASCRNRRCALWEIPAPAGSMSGLLP